MGSQPYPNQLLSSARRQPTSRGAPEAGEVESPYPNVLASSRRRRVELGGEAEKRPIEELQQTFRETRPPVEQGEPITLPAGARIERAPSPGILERAASFVRESPVGRLLGMESELTAAERERRGQPLLPAREFTEGLPEVSVPFRVGPGPSRPVEIPVTGIARGVAGTVEALSQPENVLILTALGLTGGAASGLAPGTLRTVLSTANRLVAGGFSYELLGHAWQRIPSFREALQKGDLHGAAEIGTQVALETGLGITAGRHAIRGPRARAVEPGAEATRREVFRPVPAEQPRPVRGLLPEAEVTIPLPVRAARLPEPRIVTPPPKPRLALPPGRAPQTEYVAVPGPPLEQVRGGPITMRQVLEATGVRERVSPEQRLITAYRENNRLLQDEELARSAKRDPVINRLDDAIQQARNPAELAEFTEQANARLRELRGEADFVRESDKAKFAPGRAEIAERPAGLLEREIAPPRKRARGRPTPQEVLEQERAARAWERVLREEPGERVEPPARPEVQRAAKPEELTLTLEREIADLREARQRARPEEIPQIDQRLAEAQEMLSELAARQRRAQLFGEPAAEPEVFRPELPELAPRTRERVVDEFGEEISPGGRVVDSLGRGGRVVSVGQETARVDFGRRRVEDVPLGDLTVGRRGRADIRAGIGRKPVRYFGESEEQFAERLGLPEELSANPIFNPRFWERADAFFSEKFTKPLAQRLEGLLGKLPQGVQRWLRTDFGRFPEVKQIFQEARVEIGRVREEGAALRRMWLRTKPTPEETLAAERILRGQPEDLSTAKLRPEQKAVVKQIRESAQRLTAERQALGLPVRDEWLEGPKHWYPNFFRKRLGQWIGGRLFARTGARMRPGAEALGTLKPRLSDRWWIADSTGKVVESQPGVKAIFTSPEAAEAFVREKSGFWVSYFEKGSRQLQRRTFSTLRERTKWFKKQGQQITPRQMGSAHYQVVEPLTFEQMVANGLVLDPALSVSLGWSRQAELLGKTRFLGKLGEMEGVVVDAPADGYVSLAELGFSVPRSLAERNPAIARLRDGYVYEPLARELAAIYGTSSPFNIAYRVSEGSLRKWVTFRNPWRHPRQIFENELTTALTDSGAFLDKLDQGRAFAEYARAAGGDTSVPHWKEYAASELIYTDLIRGEFQTMWRGLSEATRLQPNAPLSLTERLALWAEENPVARRVLQTDEFAQRLYRAEDQIYKWYRYSRYRNEGWTHEAAVKRVKDSYFDYSDVPVFVRVANRYIPFWVNVSYQYARIFGNQLRDYPASTMLRLAVLWHAQAFVREQMLEESGLTEQDLKNMGKLAPKAWEFVLPWTDEKGRNLVLNLAWFIPFSEVTLLRHAAIEEEPERGWMQLARRFVPMVAQPLATLATQTTAFGQRVLTGVETRTEALWKLARAAALSALPGLLGQYWDRLHRNAQAGERTKRPLWEKALVEPAVGRIERVAPAERVGLRKALTAGKQRKVSEELYRQRGRLIRGQTSGEQYREEIAKLEESLPEFAHPETLAVIDAFRRGDRTAGRAAYDQLLRSRYYADKEEANKAIDELARMQDRLAEARASRLPEVRELVEKVLDDYRESGPLDPTEVRRLMLAVRALPGDEKEGEEKLLREYLEEQVREIRRRRALPQPKVPLPPRPVPREQLYAPR